MQKRISSYYSMKQLKDLQNQGVIIPDLNSVKVGREILPENISSGSTLYPFVRINGEKTKIHSGTHIGISGATTLQDSWIGKNAIVGSLGPVTLKDVVLGPESVLGSGVAEDSVFLGKESFLNNFTTGYGFRVRKGSLFEEDSSSAQHTDTKMTILFPWVTLGSNINLCDVIFTGGTGPEMGNFSEVGSGTIHFNFTIRGDKATASLFGDVKRGIFLNKERIFIGGNNSLLGPIKSDFGVMTAANARINGTLETGLNFGRPLSSGRVSYDSKIFFGVLDIVSKQVNVLAELAALFNWYKQIRISCIAKTPEIKFVYSSASKIVELNFEERLFQLSQFLASVQSSHASQEKTNKLNKKEILEQRRLLEKWELMENRLSNLKNFEISAPESLRNSILEMQSERELNYSAVIKNLPEEVKGFGLMWLDKISKKVRDIICL